MSQFMTFLATHVRVRVAGLLTMSFLPLVVIAGPPAAAAALRPPLASSSSSTPASDASSSQSSGGSGSNAPDGTEITGDRTAYSSTYALPNGEMQTKLSTLPVNYQGASGNSAEKSTTTSSRQQMVGGKMPPALST